MQNSGLGLTEEQKAVSDNIPILEFLDEIIRVHGKLVDAVVNNQIKLTSWPIESTKKIVFVSFFELEGKVYVKFARSNSQPTGSTKNKFDKLW